jgi:hypothetical protein
MTDHDAQAQDIDAGEAAKAAVGILTSLVRKEPLGVTSLEPTDEGWRVDVEVLEHARVPSTSDLLGLYEVDLDLDGGLIGYRRLRRYSRVEKGDGERGSS